jgi:hypothetical protein
MRAPLLFVRVRRGILVSVWVNLLVFAMFFFPSGVRAQGTSTASASGTVRDASGAAVAGARVVITQTDTGFSQSTNSLEDGSFAFPVLPVGNYQLGVTKEGFTAYEQTGITLTVSQPAQFSIALQVGTVQQTIHVTAAASPVNTTNGELSGLISQEEVVDLPLNGRNPGALEFLAPGVSNPGLNSATSGPGLRCSSLTPVRPRLRDPLESTRVVLSIPKACSFQPSMESEVAGSIFRWMGPPMWILTR